MYEIEIKEAAPKTKRPAFLRWAGGGLKHAIVVAGALSIAGGLILIGFGILVGIVLAVGQLLLWAL